MTARLGIGLPVYNGERYLARTLESLRAQTHPSFEVLVLDNASTDSTPAIVAEFTKSDRRFRYERKAVNNGGPGNFNDVLRRMDNELFAWVAHDDIYDPEFFATCTGLLDTSPGTIGAFSGVAMIGPDDKWVRNVDDPLEHARWADRDPAVRFADIVRYTYGCRDIFSVFRRDILAGIEPMCVCWGSDRMLLAELSLYGRIVHVPDRLFLNREHPNRSTRLPQRDQRYLGDTRPPRAITFHYAAHLRRTIGKAPLSPAERVGVRRAYKRWAISNTGNFARSAGRAVIETARPLLSR